jgi:hypothetical protein
VEDGFLPPEPPGPAPELGGKAAPRPPEPAQAPPPAQAQAPQSAYPPPGPGYAPPGAQGQPPPPPGQPPPPGSWYPPAGQGWQQPGPQPWAYPRPSAPDNPQAIAGFVLSLVSLGLLVVSVGLSSIASVGCAIAGMVFGRKGVRRVDAGETPKHRGLGQAGFWIGLGSLILSLIATAAWIAVLVAAISDEEFRDDLEREFDGSQTLSTAVLAAFRVALHLLA